VSVRVPGSIVVRTSLANVAAARARLAVTQEQAASSLRINRPSDDPAGAARATSLRAEQAAHEQYARNVDRGVARLRAAEGALGAASEVVVRARELALQGANGSLDGDARRALAAEVAVLFDELVTAANSRHADGYTFAGTANATPAFAVTGAFAAGSPPVVTFAGSSDEIELAVGPDQRVVVTLDGRRVFLGDADGDTVPEPGRADAFATLGALWQALVDDDRDAVAATLGDLDRVQRQLELERATVGAEGARLEAAARRLADAGVETTRQLSSAQDADTVRVLSALVTQSTALEAALEAAARSVSPTLLDFLR
jgi:flagellar hook-associated protein 3 FlgL